MTRAGVSLCHSDMEHVRRRKQCLHLRKFKTRKLITVDDQQNASTITVKESSTPKTETKSPNDSKCSSHWLDCHPYHDNINLLHAMSDTLVEVFPFVVKLLFLLVQTAGTIVNDPSLQYGKRLFRRLEDGKTVAEALLKEVYYADKNQPWTESAATILYHELFGRGTEGCVEHPTILGLLQRFGSAWSRWQPTLFSQLEGNKNRTFTVCGNYIASLFLLIPQAMKYAAESKSRKEYQIHLRKLELFLALERVSKFKDNLR